MSDTITNNLEFENNNYLIVRNLWDVTELKCDPPEERGVLIQYENGVIFDTVDEGQVNGSTSRGNYPAYKHIHTSIRHKIEDLIGKKLYNTYYFDRFYFNGQCLKKHTDRDSCEISVTLHVGTNLSKPASDWPVCIQTPDERDVCVILNPGDAMLYKGVNALHWRDKMPDDMDGGYYHQIFFHYVLQDGCRSHHAWDRLRSVS
tara:strand:- start:105 stop:713 length:609 start_codon:yes stop_codon:yes gene_type:complete